MAEQSPPGLRSALAGAGTWRSFPGSRRWPGWESPRSSLQLSGSGFAPGDTRTEGVRSASKPASAHCSGNSIWPGLRPRAVASCSSRIPRRSAWRWAVMPRFWQGSVLPEPGPAAGFRTETWGGCRALAALTLLARALVVRLF